MSKKRDKKEKKRRKKTNSGSSTSRSKLASVTADICDTSYPYKTKLKLSEYETAKHLLQVELLKMQN